MIKFEKYFIKGYNMTRAAYDMAVKVARQEAPDCTSATELAELVCTMMERDDWANDSNHPIWDIAADTEAHGE